MVKTSLDTNDHVIPNNGQQLVPSVPELSAPVALDQSSDKEVQVRSAAALTPPNLLDVYEFIASDEGTRTVTSHYLLSIFNAICLVSELELAQNPSWLPELVGVLALENALTMDD